MERYCPKCFVKFTDDAIQRCPEHDVPLVSFVDKDLVGEILDDRYKVVGVLGRGGMGVVYRVEQTLIKRTLALKVLNKELVRDETQLKRFLREAQAMASLRSAHTVTLHDFGATQTGLLYYTMELLAGLPLSKVIRSEGPLKFERACEIVFQTCQSLEEAHDKGIIHRDIKPDNIFITPDEKRGTDHVTVLDFGIAKLMGDPTLETLTRTGMAVGTPAYVSPEQVLGQELTPASDLYSLAIVLYEMLAGKPPFRATTAMKLLLKHLNEEPVPVNKCNPEIAVPRSLEELIQKALRKKPEERFANVEEFRTALEQAIAEYRKRPETALLPPLTTTSDGLRSVTDEYAAKDKSLREEADQSLVATMTRGETPVRSSEPPGQAEASGGWASRQADVLRPTAAGPERPDTPVGRWTIPVVVGAVLLVAAVGGVLMYRGCTSSPAPTADTLEQRVPVKVLTADRSDVARITDITQPRDTRKELPAGFVTSGEQDIKPAVPDVPALADVADTRSSGAARDVQETPAQDLHREVAPVDDIAPPKPPVPSPEPWKKPLSEARHAVSLGDCSGAQVLIKRARSQGGPASAMREVEDGVKQCQRCKSARNDLDQQVARVATFRKDFNATRGACKGVTQVVSTLLSSQRDMEKLEANALDAKKSDCGQVGSTLTALRNKSDAYKATHKGNLSALSIECGKLKVLANQLDAQSASISSILKRRDKVVVACKGNPFNKTRVQRIESNTAKLEDGLHGARTLWKQRSIVEATVALDEFRQKKSTLMPSIQTDLKGAEQGCKAQ